MATFAPKSYHWRSRWPD